VLGECVVKINEVTEGYWSSLARSIGTDLAGGAGGINRQKADLEKRKQALQNSQAQLAQAKADIASQQQQADTQNTGPDNIGTKISNPKEGSVLLIKAPSGMEYFKSYTGAWFEKPDPVPTKFSASGALQEKDPVKIAQLEKMATKNSQVVYVKPSIPGDTVNYVADPAGQTRAAKLAATRQARKPKE